MESPASQAGLRRELGLVQATALAITDMVGIGPYITIPLFLATMGGPQAMLGWLVGAVLAFCDGLVWACWARHSLRQAAATTTCGKLTGRIAWAAGFPF